MLGNRESNRLVTVVATVVSFIFVTFLVVGSSRAALSAQTTNERNSVSTGTLNLTHTNPATAMFNVSDAKPNTPIVRCVDVTYSGTMTAASLTPVYFTVVAADGDDADAVATSTLNPYLNMQVEMLPTTCAAGGAGTQTLNDTMANVIAAPAPGFNTAWTPDIGVPSTLTRGFRVTLAVQDTNDAQGKQSEFNLTWAIQST